MKGILIFFILLIFFFPSLTYARKASLEDIKTSLKNNALFVSFKVKGCFTKKMIQAINNGVNTKFVFLIRLYKVRRFWKDRKIKELRIIHSIHYDAIKKMYILKFSEKEDKIVCKSLDEAEDTISRVSNLKIIDTKELKRGEKYQIRIKAELNKARFSFYLHRILFLLSLGGFDTGWYKLNFYYKK